MNKSMQSAYTDMMNNLAKSTVAIPVHLQGAAGALSWWQSEDSLMAKSDIAPAEATTGELKKSEAEDDQDESEKHEDKESLAEEKAEKDEGSEDEDEDKDESDEEPQHDPADIYKAGIGHLAAAVGMAAGMAPMIAGAAKEAIRAGKALKQKKELGKKYPDVMPSSRPALHAAVTSGQPASRPIVTAGSLGKALSDLNDIADQMLNRK